MIEREREREREKEQYDRERKNSMIERENNMFVYLFIWGFTSLSTLYRSYHDG